MPEETKLLRALFIDTGDLPDLSPEQQLCYHIVHRALEDILIPHNRKYKKSAVKWVRGDVIDPPITFMQCVQALQLSDTIVLRIMAKATYE